CAPAAARLGRAGYVAVRCPGALLLRELARSAPLVSTSANRTGQPAPASLSAVAAEIRAGCDVEVDAGTLAGGGSTVIRPEPDGTLSELRPGLWRPGRWARDVRAPMGERREPRG
ncbi:MAG: Sua5/YciO/YrdC/YwlC family protein, partial [Gemmatimonadetes bacterium]|nr:Sua5/YciO/YrdC/YwlC family protein [Gemmatimonadota bacterium]